MLAPRPTPKLEDHPSSALLDCLFNLFAATLHKGGRSSIRNLRTRHAVVTGTHYMVLLDYILNIILNSVRQHNHCITQGDYKATCFDYRLVILRPVLLIVSQDAMHTLGSHRVYIHGMHQIKSFFSKGVTCKLCLQEWSTKNWIICTSRL